MPFEPDRTVRANAREQRLASQTGSSSSSAHRAPPTSDIEHTLGSAYVRLFFAFLQFQGYDPARLYGKQIIERFANPAPGRPRVREWNEWVTRAEIATGDDGLLFRLAEFVRPADAGLVGFLTMACATLREAVEVVCAFSNVLGDAYTLSTGSDGKRITIEMTPTGPARFPRLEVFMLALICRHARTLSRMTDLVFDAKFSFAKPRRANELAIYRSTFDRDLSFGHPCSAITCQASYGDLPVSPHPPAMAEMLRRELRSLQNRMYSPAHLLAHRLDVLLQSWPTLSDICMKDVASALGLPEYALQAGLREANTTFRLMADLERKKRALRLVTDFTIPLGDVARLAGYENQPALNRAFQRWTGRSPGEVRRDYLLHGTVEGMDRNDRPAAPSA